MAVINHPDYYNKGIEVIDFIESHHLGFSRGNIIKYVSRAGLKGDAQKEVEDLEKAKWYIEREIENAKRRAAGSQPPVNARQQQKV